MHVQWPPLFEAELILNFLCVSRCQCRLSVNQDLSDIPLLSWNRPVSPPSSAAQHWVFSSACEHSIKHCQFWWFWLLETVKPPTFQRALGESIRNVLRKPLLWESIEQFMGPWSWAIVPHCTWTRAVTGLLALSYHQNHMVGPQGITRQQMVTIFGPNP